ncbi:MAG: PP2C family protein-serine/threonine phosphatase [Acidobacteriaceae bacterium]
MKKLPLPLLLLVLCSCGMAHAQSAASSAFSAFAGASTQARPAGWITDIDKGWRSHEGDNPAYAQPGFDDTSWRPVQLDDLGAAQTGWRWFRLHTRLPADHSPLALLIEGGEGIYEVYVNGVAVPGPKIRSSVYVRDITERTVQLNVSGDDLVVALRTHVPPCYPATKLPEFMSASLGTRAVIEQARQALQSVRLYAAFPSIAINLLLLLAGIGAIALYRNQPLHPEYLWLGLYLLLTGLSSGLWGGQVNGLFPLSANYLVGDPMVYLFTIAQIEFTYSFGGRHVGRFWRVYEVLLLTPILLTWFVWHGQVPLSTYLIIEGLIVVPVAPLLPILLFVWYRRGNREAGWLILPSLVPAALVTLNDLAGASILLGWHRLDFLHHWIPIGAARFQPDDIGDLLFLLGVSVVMFFRFARVSREQARTAAEFAAARDIQQRLVPVTLPPVPGCRVQAAYLPAEEVGGDFYQILDQPGGARLIVIGDVSGKGLKAAMTGAVALGALRTLADDDLGPADLLARLNRQIVSAQDSGFITCLCARILTGGQLAFANAGHLPLYRNGQEVECESGLPLGIAPDATYTETTLQLAPGDTLTFLSDGVVEARDPKGELFGFDRTRDISNQAAEHIAQAAQNFGQEDDITVLTLQFAPAGVLHA